MGAAYMAIGMFISSTTENQVIAAVLSFLVFLITYLMSYIVQVVPSDNLSAWIIFSVLNLVIGVVLYTSLKNINVALIFVGAVEVILTALYILKPDFYDGSVVKFLNWFSLFERYKAFGLGIIDFASVIYYLSLVFLFWFLTVQTIKKRRWN